MNDIDDKKEIPPFLIWAGGKRWFVRNYEHLLPSKFNRYIEPFLGSGAVFFHLKPKNALLGDSNHELIETYLGIKEDYRGVVRLLKEHAKKHCESYYYAMRKAAPAKSRIARAARFIYFNRTCWNGLYRVNLKGKFNVPIGTKTSIIRPEDDFASVASLLQNADLIPGDFKTLIDVAGKDDLLFVDPPYTVSHNQNAFIKYNERLFSWADQIRLAAALARAARRGALIIATNAAHKSVKELYREKFILKNVSRMSTISCNNDTRKSYKELVILSNKA